jgi:hypothetical protein
MKVAIFRPMFQFETAARQLVNALRTSFYRRNISVLLHVYGMLTDVVGRVHEYLLGNGACSVT